MGSAEDSMYPKPLVPFKGVTVSESSLVQQALADGLDSNAQWTEKDLIKPVSRGGCVMLPYISDTQCWPHYNTPLHRAVRFSDYEAAEVLLRHGADIDGYNALGKTPLYEAVWIRDHDALRFVFAHGADVNKETVAAHVRYEDDDRDMYGQAGGMALHAALRRSDTVTLQLLVEAGADLSPESQKPWSAMDLALLAGDRKAVEMLLSQPQEVDHSKACQRLLDFSKSDMLVPPAELHEAYRFAIQQVKEVNLHRISSLAEVGAFFQRFFQVLRDEVGVGKGSAGPRCASCRKFEAEVGVMSENKDTFAFDLHQSRADLNTSANNGCLLCKIVADGLDQAHGRRDQDLEDQKAGTAASPSPIMLCPNFVTTEEGDWFMSMELSCGEQKVSLDISEVDKEWLPACEAVEEMSASTDSPQAMEVAKKWLQDCRHADAHAACREAYDKLQTSEGSPARLLYIGGTDGDIRMVEGPDAKSPYCALSYCWGQQAFIKTTRATLEQHKTGIPLPSFPAIMREAVHVGQVLGFQYLWIDALCIIQDDPVDWSREAANMHAIYSNAAVTISSLTSKDCNTGLFTPRSLRVMHPVVLDFWRPKQYLRAHSSQAVFPQFPQNKPDLRGPVHSRAWTLQEQLLSTRILYFGDGMLHWECLEGYKFEADPTGNRLYGYRSVLEEHTKLKRSLKSIMSSEHDRRSSKEVPPEFEAFEHWKSQLEEFTRRKLTKSTDRLPAFGSISRNLSRVAGNEFVYGIWKGNRFLESLCWRMTEPGTLSQTDMPSWSWAAMTGEVSFDLIDRMGRGTDPVRPRVEIVSLDLDGRSQLPETRPSMTVKGILLRKKAVDAAFLGTEEPSYLGLPLQSGVLLDSCVFLDHKFEGTQELYAINLLSFESGPPPKGYGYPAWPGGRPPATVQLLLQKQPTGSNVYKRIGVGIWPGVSVDEDYEMTGEDFDEITPLDWLILDESSVENEIVIV
ncbi:hypothetical protein PRZ48_010115 [Zasmidium cellare]|uniref:Heterokaryon incompatibility domain-containing protein n=1 Tax=Zasmidium cellare TaxID=395010 RepID=A0ABR0EDP4_ZASCE|nr:hypothetical protein PRZ48_010115 [Zasmidium cellare]